MGEIKPFANMRSRCKEIGKKVPQAYLRYKARNLMGMSIMDK